MPGMTNRRRAIQEGTDWTNPKAKGYNFGGPVRVGQGKSEIPGVADAIASATQAKKRGYNFGGKVRVGTGKGRNTPVIEDAVASATQAKKKKLRKR